MEHPDWADGELLAHVQYREWISPDGESGADIRTVMERRNDRHWVERLMAFAFRRDLGSGCVE